MVLHISKHVSSTVQSSKNCEHGVIYLFQMHNLIYSIFFKYLINI